MTESTDKLTAKQQKAITALMSSSTIGAAAAAVGVNERTIYTWLADTAFSAAYRAARREATQQAIARLQQVSSPAAERLEYLLTCGKPAIELGAARSILEFAIKAVELEDLQQRLTALEAAYAAKH